MREKAIQLLRVLVVLCVTTNNLLAQPTWRWATSDGSSRGNDANQTNPVISPAGHVITLGSTGERQTAQFPFGPRDFFLTATDSSGVVQWSRHYATGGTAECNPYQLTQDAAGNLYVLINFTGTINLGAAGTFTSSSRNAGVNDGLLVKLDNTGNVLWARQFEGTARQTPDNIIASGLAVDRVGNLWVGGSFQTQVTCGSYTLTTLGNLNGFLARLSAQGVVLGLFPISSTATAKVEQVQADSRGYVYVAGNMVDNALVGPFSLQAPNNDFYLAKFDLQMNPLWVRRSGNGNYTNLTGFTLTHDGGYVVAGSMRDSTRFGSYTYYTPPPNPWDGFYVRYDSLGQVRWAQRITGSSIEVTGPLAVDDADNVYAAGWHLATATLAGTVLPTMTDSTNGYVVRFTQQGNAAWVVPVGGPRMDVALGVALGPGNAVYVTGGYQGSVSFGSATLTSTGFMDAFLARLNGGGPLGITPEENAQALALYPNPSSSTGGIRLTLATSLTETGVVRILSSLGQVVYEALMPTGTQQMTLQPHEIAQGIYVVQVRLGSKNVSRKLVIE